MTNTEVMELVAEQVYEACLNCGAEDSEAFNCALDAARNASEPFRLVYGFHMDLHEQLSNEAGTSETSGDGHDHAWNTANDAAWDDIFHAAYLAVIGHGFQLADDEGLTDKEQIDARVDAYVDSVLD